MLNLDTHILIYALCDQLTAKEKRLLLDKRWCISAIVLWEIAKLNQLGRISIDLRDPVITRALRDIDIFPITIRVCQAISDLDFHSDPADEIIAATSIVDNIPLLTRDKKIKKSKVVPLAG